MCLIFIATLFGSISSTTPMLALMLGLAVGIDYSLFIISRHQAQLKAGVDPEESAARAVATAGSAVLFAGITVIIALAGLAVAGIPFLTTMGLAAPGDAEATAPVPEPVTRANPSLAHAAKADIPKGPFRTWVRAVTRFPIVT